MSAALRHLRRDRRLAPVIRQHAKPALRPTRNSFRSLARAIIYQQLSGKAAGTICRRFVALYPGCSFPRPGDVQATPVAMLRGVGLSRQKASYVKDLAGRFADGTIPSRRLSRLSDDEIATLLTQVKGIGPWTVDMFLIFALNRPDVLPLGDLGIKKGFRRLLELETLPGPREMERLAEPWRPYRSVACWYLWRVAEAEVPAE